MPSECQTLALTHRTEEEGAENKNDEQEEENEVEILEESALRILSSTVPGTLPAQLSVSLSF